MHSALVVVYTAYFTALYKMSYLHYITLHVQLLLFLVSPATDLNIVGLMQVLQQNQLAGQRRTVSKGRSRRSR